MGTSQRIALIGLSAWLSACSLVNDFDGFAFGDKEPGSDGGSAGSGGAGSGGADGGVPDSGVDAATGGTAGTGSDGGGGSSGMGGGDDAGMDSGSAGGPADTGVDAGPECTKPSDCGDVLAFDCVNDMCVPRRVASGVWLSGGGGLVSTPTTKIRVSVGAPVPMGRATSATFRVTVGPGAGRP